MRKDKHIYNYIRIYHIYVCKWIVTYENYLYILLIDKIIYIFSYVLIMLIHHLRNLFFRADGNYRGNCVSLKGLIRIRSIFREEDTSPSSTFKSPKCRL